MTLWHAWRQWRAERRLARLLATRDVMQAGLVLQELQIHRARAALMSVRAERAIRELPAPLMAVRNITTTGQQRTH